MNTAYRLACLSLLLFEGMPTLWIGIASFMMATIGFGGGIVFYNSYLPDIVSEDHYDSVSAKGFSYGYVGSVLLLIVNLAIIMKYERESNEKKNNKNVFLMIKN